MRDKSLAAREAGIALQPPPDPHKPEYGVFFQFAKEHCCNYSAAGPWGKKHYCWLEPRETHSFCVIPWGKYCRWFVEAVLPLKRDLELAWHRLRGTARLDHKAKQEHECVDCGKAFMRTSNRQKRCEDCARKKANMAARERKRRQRSRGGQTVTL
ncbi:MAG: hypothetical protein QME75_14520 [Deltaproteobacteria bacterium]|nr:hypothetical protein [Deltaproteobacteria bacterium]